MLARQIRQVLICFQVNRMQFPHFKIEEFRVKIENDFPLRANFGNSSKLGRVKIGGFKSRPTAAIKGVAKRNEIPL